MKRKITSKLYEWKNMSDGRMPLLIYGARQVGKTFEMREFGSLYYKNTIYVNFETDERIGKYFETDIHADHVIAVLEKYYQAKIVPENTLIIFDEIQMCERALTSLKYFSEEAPEYHVMAAGSLLGVAVNREKYSFPVGKVQMLTMYPMDLEEVLWAKGKQMLTDTIREHYENNQPLNEMLHEEAMQEFYHYCIVGGMPAAVKADLAKDSPIEQTEIRQMLLNSYIADMTKYANKSDTVRIFEAYDSLPAQLAKENRKFIYGVIKEGARAKDFELAMEWLIDAGLIYKVNRVKKFLQAEAGLRDFSAFKLFMLDTGLMGAMSGLPPQTLLEGNILFTDYKGAITEQYVLQQLKSVKGLNIYYWSSDTSKGELDFLLQKEIYIIPVEVKAEENLQSKSLRSFVEKNPGLHGIRFSMSDYRQQEWLTNYPLYSVGYIF